MNIEDPAVLDALLKNADAALSARTTQAAAEMGKVVSDALAGLQTLIRGASLNLQATADSTVLNTEALHKVIAGLDGWTAEITLSGSLSAVVGTVRIRLTGPK